MKAYKFLSVGIISIFLSAYFFFMPSKYAPIEYVKWIVDSENGLRKIKTVGDLTVDLQYKPIPFVIANELRKNNINEHDFKKRSDELKGAQYYTLKLKVDSDKATDITKYNVNNIQEHQRRLYYLSYEMKDDIKLIDGMDTLSVQLYHFERSYDITPHRTFVLAFNENEKSIGKDKTFILDSEQFGTGPIKIKFTKQELNNLPILKLQK